MLLARMIAVVALLGVASAQAGTTVSGRVVDAGGKPVQGAEVLLVPFAEMNFNASPARRPGRAAATTSTDATGRFELAVPGDQLFDVWVLAKDTRKVRVPLAWDQLPTTTSFTLRLAADASGTPGLQFEGKSTNRQEKLFALIDRSAVAHQRALELRQSGKATPALNKAVWKQSRKLLASVKAFLAGEEKSKHPADAVTAEAAQLLASFPQTEEEKPERARLVRYGAPPTHPSWGYSPLTYAEPIFGGGYGLSDEEARRLVLEIARTNQSDPVRLNAIASFARDADLRRSTEDRRLSEQILTTQFAADDKDAAMLLAQVRAPLAEPGQTFPAFTCTGRDGKPVKVDWSKDPRPLRLVNFVTTWCGSCTYLWPHLDKLAADPDLSQLQIVNVFLHAKPGAVEKYLTDKKQPSHGIICEVAEPKTETFIDRAHVYRYPTSMLLDGRGAVIADGRDLVFVRLYDQVKAALKNHDEPAH